MIILKKDISLYNRSSDGFCLHHEEKHCHHFWLLLRLVLDNNHCFLFLLISSKSMSFLYRSSIKGGGIYAIWVNVGGSDGMEIDCLGLSSVWFWHFPTVLRFNVNVRVRLCCQIRVDCKLQLLQSVQLFVLNHRNKNEFNVIFHNICYVIPIAMKITFANVFILDLILSPS